MPDSRTEPARYADLTIPRGTVHALAFAPDGRSVATAGPEGRLSLWDARTGAERRLRQGPEEVRCLAFSDDGTRLAAGLIDGTVEVWDPRRGAALESWRAHDGWVRALDWDEAGTLLATAGNDRSVALWDSKTGALRLRLADQPDRVLGVAFAPGAARLAAATGDGSLRLWQAGDRRFERLADDGTLALSESDSRAAGWLRSVVFSPDGRLVAAAAEDGVVRLWDAATARLREALEGHRAAVGCVAFSPDGALLASRSTDGIVRLWDARVWRPVATLADAAALPGQDLAFDPRRPLLATAAPGRIRLWRLDAETLAAPERGRAGDPGLGDLDKVVDALRADPEDGGRVLILERDLFAAWRRAFPGRGRRRFDDLVRDADRRGRLRRLALGPLVCLGPERCDRYAEAIARAAREDPAGLGAVDEDDVLAGRLPIAEDERLDRDAERLLLRALVDELARAGRLWRQPTAAGVALVDREAAAASGAGVERPVDASVRLAGRGAGEETFATLLVALARSGLFEPVERAANAARFEASLGGACRVWIGADGEVLEVLLAFPPETGGIVRRLFEETIRRHLARRGGGEVTRERLYVCPACGTPLTPLAVERRRERGHGWILCGVCDTRINLRDGEDAVG